jgi:mannose-6-phosphate isomerase-like protein (cupin superfamily)
MKHEKMTRSVVADSELPQSKILRYREDYTWDERIRRTYKDEDGNWKGVTRTSLVGGSDGLPLPFHLRYFEVEVGGFSTLEKHEHQHVVVIVRGRGQVTLGQRQAPIGYGDVVYIAPWEVRQFCNPDGPEPLGFLCMVPAERDRPVPVERTDE